MIMRYLSRLMLLMIGAALCTLAQAQFPSKPIRLVVPFPPGGLVDGVSRAVAQSLSQSLGQPVIVDNRPGGDGVIAAGLVQNAPADGAALFFATNTAFNAVPAMRKKPPYDPVADFTPISLLGRIGVYVFAAPHLPVKTLAELVQYARANPGKLNYGTGHATGILATAQLMSLTKISMVHIPYKGDAAIMTDMMGGRLDLSIASPVPGLALAKAGKVRLLATLLDKRNPSFPDVPTMAEAGFPEYSLVAWGAIFGPANLPREITDRLSREVNLVLERPEVREALNRADFSIQGSTPEGLATFLKKQIDTWERAVADAGLQKE